MHLKKIICLLLGVIALMIILIDFSFSKIHQTKKNEQNNTAKIINSFEQKFHSDSLDLIKKHELIVDLLSQKIIDSIASTYEIKLKLVLSKNGKYKQLLKINNIDYSKINLNSSIHNSDTKLNIKPSSNNVTTYTQFPKYINPTANATVHAQLPDPHLSSYSKNVTTYTQLPGYNSNPYLRPNSSNVTTYTQLPNYRNSSASHKKQEPSKIATKPFISNYNNIQTASKKTNIKDVSMHSSQELKNATNVNNIQNIPVFPGCNPNTTKKEKINCFTTRISSYIFENFKTDNIKTQGLKKGVNNVRVIFIINENGNSKLTKIYGKWTNDVKAEISRVIKSIPKMQAGRSNGRSKPVKYSILIPFIIN